MPRLVVVFNESRSLSKMVYVNSLEDLIVKAREKLILGDGNFKAFMDNDGVGRGSEIDEDEILEILSEEAQQRQERLAVIIVPEGKPWPNPNVQPAVLQPQHVPDVHPPTRSTRISTDSGHGLEMYRIVEALEEALVMLNDSSVPPAIKAKHVKKAKKTTYRILGEHMAAIKDYSLPKAKDLAKEIVYFDKGKYGKIFQITINNVISSDGVLAFSSQLYNHLNYSKGDENTMKRKATNNETDVDEPEPATTDQVNKECGKKKRVETAKYGCINYSPPLPIGETKATQEVLRSKLLDLDEDDQAACGLMESTFASQRSTINASKDIATVFTKWPLLKTSTHFLGHASKLLGMNVIEKWSTVLETFVEPINAFMTAYWAKQHREHSPAAAHMIKLITAKTVACVSNRSEIAAAVLVFPLIIGYFQEEQDVFYLRIPANAELQEVTEAAQAAAGNPIIIISGDSVFDDNATTYVTVGGDSVIKASNTLEGILIMFCAFYNLGFHYTKEIQTTLEFMQRFFFCINPPHGDKRKSKRRGREVDSNVEKLSMELQAYISEPAVGGGDEDA